jgi:retron-type reverse transcriptase
MDAIEAIHMTMSKKHSSQWVLDADISGCFGAPGQARRFQRV